MWVLFVFTALSALLLAACSDSVGEGTPGSVDREAEFKALVDDAFANPMSQADSAKYALDVESAAGPNQLLVDHFYTTSTDERTRAEGDGYIYEGSAGLIFATGVEEGRVPLYRLNNPDNLDHFYTVSANERDYAESIGYTYEGKAGFIYPPDAGDGADRTPFYRFFNIRTSDHFYTISEQERSNLEGQQEWQYEGIAGYLPTEGDNTTPFYRLIKEVKPAPPCSGEGLSDADEDALLNIVNERIAAEETLSPEELNSLSQTLIDQFGCDYNVNGLLMTQMGGSGVALFDFAQFADVVEQQTADMDLSADQQQLLSIVNDTLRQAGTQLVSYDDLSLNFDLGDLEENEAVIATRFTTSGEAGIGFNCPGAVCATPEADALLYDAQGNPISFSFAKDAVIIEANLDVFEGIPVIDFGVGIDVIYDESEDADAGLFETIVPDQINIDAGADFCGGTLCAGGEINLEFDEFFEPGFDYDPGFIDSILDPLT